MNYRRDEQTFISVQEILDDYVNNSSEKENFFIASQRTGRVESREELTVAEYGSTLFQKPQDWKKTVLNGPVTRSMRRQPSFTDWTFVVHVNSRKVAKETVGVFELGAS